MNAYHGRATRRKMTNPFKKTGAIRKFHSLLIPINKMITNPGKINPNGPLVRTAKAEKMKVKIIPAYFLGGSIYAQKNDVKDNNIKTVKIVSVRTNLATPTYKLEDRSINAENQALCSFLKPIQENQ